jgi:hypothetical protein
MRFVLALSVVLLAVPVSQAAGTEDPEKVVKEMLKSMEDVTTLLKTIKDKSSAEAALPKLEEPLKRLAASAEKLKKLPTNLDTVQAMTKYAKELAAAGLALTTETKRVAQQPEAAKVMAANPAWKQLGPDAKPGSAIDRARTDVKALEQAVATYYVKNGGWPQSLQELAQPQADGGSAYITTALLTDPWGRPYQYDLATRHPKTNLPLIWSNGPNPNDPAGRIANWESKAKADKQ